MDAESINFGRFRLELGRRELLREGEPMRLHGRALDILCALGAAKGEVVSKDELMARLWPGRIVEEGNIHVHVSALRKALDEHGGGHSYIVTVPGRGYRLAGLVDAFGVVPSTTQILPLPDKSSIAVLPFANLSGDPEQEYFADGMVEEIITALSRIRWLFVIARNSSFTYKDQAVDVKQVGRELGVRYVLEGSVRKGGGRVRITAQLVEAETGAHLWADRFDGSLEDVFDLQDKVAVSVAGAIEPTLQIAEIRRSIERPSRDVDAYDLYLRALGLAFSWERNGLTQALDLLERAIERDPHYGSALVEVAFRHFEMHINGWSENLDSSCSKGVEFARRALRVAGDDPNVLSKAAFVLAYFGEAIDVAIALLDRGLELNPSSARSWQWSGWLRLWAGQSDLAIKHFETSLRLNPREQRANPLMGIGVAHFSARRFEEARVGLLQSLQEKPNWVPTYRVLASCYAHMGRLDEARETVARLRTQTTVVIPSAAHWRNSEHRKLFLSGLRLAAGETT
jgi:adenylate cyclase